jgi:YegS/Rv2252/BmrU family lipid kinase
VHAAKRALANGSNVLVAAGGDGTISGVASVAMEAQTRLGIIPAGTFNHFAKALSIPLDPEQAADVIAAGVTTDVDVAEVNGHVFLNNSSLGLYPLMVVLRRNKVKTGLNRWLAQIWAAVVSLARMPMLTIAVTADGETVTRRTPMIFIGNNEYEVEGARAGERGSLANGKLFVSIVRATSRMHFVHMALLALIGRLRDREEFEALSSTEATVKTRRGVVRVSLDGEVTLMRPPLKYVIRPRALRVFTPSS